jgi:hypothetical protein
MFIIVLKPAPTGAYPKPHEYNLLFKNYLFKIHLMLSPICSQVFQVVSFHFRIKILDAVLICHMRATCSAPFFLLANILPIS